MDEIITVLGYKNFITEMSDAPDCLCHFGQNFILSIQI